MKKFLCVILAIGMVCGATAFVGCKNKKGGSQNSSQEESFNDSNSFVQRSDNVVEVPGGDSDIEGGESNNNAWWD